MKITIEVSCVIILITTSAITACGPSEASRRRADSAIAAATKAHVVSQAGEVIGARREAQTFLDSARVEFVLRHRAAAASHLKAAALFTRGQSDNAIGMDKDALVQSAEELDHLAGRVAAGGVASVRTLDRAIARMQLAEAQFHYTRMLAAWNRHEAGAAGAELTMSIDHFDRGVAEAGLHLTTDTQATLARVRALAAEMTKGSVLARPDADATLTVFDSELQRVSPLIAPRK
jgi:hypothetical protein